MFEYRQMLEELSYDMEGPSKTPAANHLFMINEKRDILSKEKA